MYRAVLIAAFLIVSTSATADKSTVDAANEFAAFYNVWAKAANQHQPGELSLTEQKAWQQVKQSFKRLDRSLNGWH